MKWYASNSAISPYFALLTWRSSVGIVCPLPLCVGKALFPVSGWGLLTVDKSCFSMLPALISPPPAWKCLWFSTDAKIKWSAWMSERQHGYLHDSLASDSIQQFSKFNFQRNEELDQFLMFTFIQGDFFHNVFRGWVLGLADVLAFLVWLSEAWVYACMLSGCFNTIPPPGKCSHHGLVWDWACSCV